MNGNFNLNRSLVDPLVSIGIPTYNRSKSLQKTIQSAIKQEYSNIEIVICDNASTDATQVVCEKYVSLYRNIKYYRTPKNQGPLYNFNSALQNSTGEYFMWLADDDYIDANYVVECVKLLMTDENLVVVGGRAKFFDGKYDGLGRKFDIRSSSVLVRLCTYYWAPYDNSIFYGVMRRDLANQNNINASISADWEFVAGMASRGGLVTVDRTYIHRRAGGVSASLRKIVERLGISPVHAYLLGTSIALNSAGDILWGNRIYQHLSFQKKSLLAVFVFFVNIFKHGFYKTIRVLFFHFSNLLLGVERYEKLKKLIKARYRDRLSK